MTTILIDGKVAALPKNFSFEYNVENRDFSSADGYTLNISLPLKGCPENIAIFGNLSRLDKAVASCKYDCQILAPQVSLRGVAVITKVESPNIEVQFLEGRSVSNYDTSFDEIYINELSLGRPDRLEPSDNASDDFAGPEFYAYPWYNESAGLDYLENEMGNNGGANPWRRVPEETLSNNAKMSWQISLYALTQRIFDAVGYRYSMAEWQVDNLSKLIVCNALPSAWELPDIQRALPHWTVSEYIEQLEYLLDGWFDVDHRLRYISFRSRSGDYVNQHLVQSIVEMRSVEVDAERERQHRDDVTLKYADRSDEDWKFECCEWLGASIDNAYGIGVTVFDTMADLLAEASKYKSVYTRQQRSMVHRIYYAKDIAEAFVLRKIAVTEGSPISDDGYTIHFRLQPINVFGARHYEPEDSKVNRKEVEVKIVPVRLADTGQGTVIFLNPSSYSEFDPETETGWTTVPILDVDDDWYARPEDLIRHGDTDSVPEYYDKLYVAYHEAVNLNADHYPCPYVDCYKLHDDWQTEGLDYSSGSLSLKRQGLRLDRRADLLKRKIVFDAKYSVQFLATEMPDVASIFNIKGKQYVCEKLSYSFDKDGMSQLVKGDFYLLADDE